MKGFPPSSDGPLGKWYQRINRTIAEVVIGTPKSKVIDLLGEPDENRPDTVSAGAEWQHLMESVAGGPTLIGYGNTTPIEEVLIYRDPYRTRAYCYGIHNDCVQGTWIQDTRVGSSE